MPADILHGQTLLRIAVSPAGVSLRRVCGDDPLVQEVFGDTAAPDARDWVVETGFFYGWLFDTDGRPVGVEAMFDMGRLTPADRRTLGASGRAAVGHSLVVRFTAEGDAEAQPGAECDSALIRTSEGLVLLLGDNAGVACV